MNAKLCKKLRKQARKMATKKPALIENVNGSLVNAKGSYKDIYKMLKKEGR